MRLSIKGVAAWSTCLLLMSIALSNCNSSNPTTSTGPTTDNMNLNWAQINGSVNFFPYYVATKQGYFKAQGLKINDKGELQTGTKVAAALEANDITIAGGVITDVFTLQPHDAGIKVIGALDNGYVVDIVVSNKFERETGLTENSPLDEKLRRLRAKTSASQDPTPAHRHC